MLLPLQKTSICQFISTKFLKLTAIDREMFKLKIQECEERKIYVHVKTERTIIKNRPIFILL